MLVNIPKNSKVAVIGGGISGLTFSYFLTKLRPDVKINIYERQKETGGYIKSLRLKDESTKEDIIVEKGPRTLRGVSDGTLLIVDILKSLNLSDNIKAITNDSISNKKYLLNDKNEFIEVPNSFKSLLGFLKSGILNGAIWGVIKEPFVKQKQSNEDESIESFISRRFSSSTLNDNIISAVFHGIYAGDSSKLSVKSTMPSMVSLEGEKGSIFRSVFYRLFQKYKNRNSPETKPQLSEILKDYELKLSPNADLKLLSKRLKTYPLLRLEDGLQVLPNALTKFLSNQPNVSIHYNTDISLIDPLTGTITCNKMTTKYDHIRSTINTNALTKLLKQSEELSDILKLDYVNIFLCNIYSKNGKLIPGDRHGFGFLVPKSKPNPECLLGAIFDSDIEQHESSLFGKRKSNPSPKNYNKITLMMGGHYYDKLGSIPSNSINTKIVKLILQDILKVDLNKFNIIFRDEACESNKTINLSDDDILVTYNLISDCIPQYNVGYQAQKVDVDALIERKYNGKFSLGGMSFGSGIGVPDCVLNAWEDASQAKK